MAGQLVAKRPREEDNANANDGLEGRPQRARQDVEHTVLTSEMEVESGTSASAIAASTGAGASAGAESASGAAPTAGRLPIVLVSVGGGQYWRPDLPLNAVRAMDGMALLIALSESKGFEASLKGVALDKCRVFVVTSTAKKPADGVQGTEVETTDTFGDVIAKDLPAGTNVFIRVELPQVHTVGAMAGPTAELAASVEAGRRLMAAIKNSNLQQWPSTAALQVEATTMEQQTFIIRLEDAAWPQLGNVPLFVRSFYLPCIRGAMANLDPDVKASLRRFIVLGNGGIGKSAFGLVLLRHALLQQPARPVIYLSDKTEDAWVFRPDGKGGHDVKAFMKRDLDAQPELKDARTVLLADSLRPPQVAAFTVMITSPARDRYKDFFAAQPCEKLLFDPLSWEEIVDMRDSCFPSRSNDNLREGYALSGGIPRMVFAYDTRKALREVQSALTKITLPILANDIDSPEVEADSHSHRLLHMISRGRMLPQEGCAPISPSDLAFYEPSHSELASRQVASMVYRRLDAVATQQLHAILARPPSEEILSLFYGEVYEPAALDKLTKGGKFSRLDVQTGIEDTNWALPAASKFEYVDNAAQLRSKFEQDRNQMLVPCSKSFTAIDAVLPGGRLTNITINIKHDVKLRGRGKRHAEGLLPTAAAIGMDTAGTAPIDLYWAMPDERYQELKRDIGVSTKKKDVVSHFTLVIPEEDDMLVRLKQLTSKAAAATTTGAKEAAEHELKAYKQDMEPLVKEWKRLKDRVRHFALRVQFHTLAESAGAASAVEGTGSRDQ